MVMSVCPLDLTWLLFLDSIFFHPSHWNIFKEYGCWAVLKFWTPRKRSSDQPVTFMAFFSPTSMASKRIFNLSGDSLKPWMRFSKRWEGELDILPPQQNSLALQSLNPLERETHLKKVNKKWLSLHISSWNKDKHSKYFIAIRWMELFLATSSKTPSGDL